MIWIRVNEDNIIIALSKNAIIDMAAYSGFYPEDLWDVYGLQKYLFINGEIILNPEWTES